MKNKFSSTKVSPLRRLLIVILCFYSLAASAQNEQIKGGADGKRSNLDRTLQPNANDEISSLFENVVAVQRKAKVKSGSFLFNPYFSFDFSDSPYTMWGLNLNLGYALGEFWEVYLNYVPSYVNNERSVAKKVRNLQLANGQQADLAVEKAKSSAGIEINWVPIYGKDSWGPYGIIRSDTFLNFGYSQMKYTNDESGAKYKLALGKTFFLSDLFNVRFSAGASSVQMVSLGVKESVTIGLIELGLVFYY